MVEKGPYLIYPGENSQMMALWQLTTSTTCLIEWGRDGSFDEGSTTTVEYSSSHQHGHWFTDLVPGDKYSYRVSAGGDLLSGSFLAAPPKDARAVKFLVYGDCRTSTATHSAVCEAYIDLYRGEPDFQTFALITGDMNSYGHLESSWSGEFFNRGQAGIMQFQSEVPIQACMGNHEAGGALYQKYLPYPFVDHRYYSFDYGPAHVTVVDQFTSSTWGVLGAEQLRWIEEDLKGSDKKWKFVLLHIPGWGAGPYDNDPTVQEVLQPLCVKYGVSFVFSGHNHSYSHASVNGVHHVTTGGAGAPLYVADPERPFVLKAERVNHYCSVEIQEDLLTFRVFRLDGKILDSFDLDFQRPSGVSGNWRAFNSHDR